MSRIDKDNAPSLTMVRFPNLSGALVLVTAKELGRSTAYSWRCTGCLKDAHGAGLGTSRDEANEHSAKCRALPQPARTDESAA